MNQPYRRATIYILSEHGYGKTEARDVKHWLTKHAQYDNAIGLEFTPKSARSVNRWGVTQPLIILEGWGHPQQEVWVNSERNGYTVNEPRFPFFDEAWQNDFDNFLTEYLLANPNIEVLADYRKHQLKSSTISWTNLEDDPFDDSDPFADAESSKFSAIVVEGSEPNLYTEGSAKEVTITVYERNPKARKECIEHYGWNCCICDFNFRAAYGDAGANFIHVHHLTPIAEIAESYIVNPIQDLRPVCANCHSIIHRRTPHYSLQEMSSFTKRG